MLSLILLVLAVVLFLVAAVVPFVPPDHPYRIRIIALGLASLAGAMLATRHLLG